MRARLRRGGGGARTSIDRRPPRWASGRRCARRAPPRGRRGRAAPPGGRPAARSTPRPATAAADEAPVDRACRARARGAEGVAAQHEEDRAPPALPPLARVRRSPRRQRLASGTHHFCCCAPNALALVRCKSGVVARKSQRKAACDAEIARLPLQRVDLVSILAC